MWVGQKTKYEAFKTYKIKKDPGNAQVNTTYKRQVKQLLASCEMALIRSLLHQQRPRTGSQYKANKAQPVLFSGAIMSNEKGE